ncbi:MAG: BtrH N-terminal domain-containing protein [Desulfobacterales bacterium]|nr:BtrH N-terminal domain-containing protein [Desulfobacterales bacterium]
MKIDFTHRQSAHCESGAISNLLYHYGVNMSEALAFGIGGGIFFAHIPFIKLNKLPLTTFRCPVGAILKRVTTGLGIGIERKKFRSHDKAMNSLDRKIEEGVPVGCQTGAYWLPYFPPAFRFHFNMHNLIVYGREDNKYLVSDPVMPEPSLILRKELIKARFARGALAPKGNMYYLTSVPEQIDFKKSVIKGINTVCKIMLKSPVPIVGIRGMHYLAKKLEAWPRKFGEKTAVLYLGQIVRMQEEIGTGGAGFRYIYAAFLQEAADILQDKRLNNISKTLTGTGDTWRKFAVSCARNCKGRETEQDSYPPMAEMLRDCANSEREVFRKLQSAISR